MMDLNTLYSTAYAYYESGLFAEAGNIFTKLTLDDPQEEAYWRGLAAARQMEHKYKSALYAWGLVSILSKDDPMPHFHAAECMLSLNQREEAKTALNAALQLAREDLHLRTRIEVLKEACHAS